MNGLSQPEFREDEVVTSSDRTYYRELGVDEDASPSRIHAAFRELARRYHPDRNPHDGAAEENFKRINAAYLVLCDATKREAYDRQLRAVREVAAERAGGYPGRVRAPAATPTQQGGAVAPRAADRGVEGTPSGPPSTSKGDVVVVSYAALLSWLTIVALLPFWFAFLSGLGLVAWATYRWLQSRRAIPTRAQHNPWMTAAILASGLLAPVVGVVKEAIRRKELPIQARHEAEQSALALREAGWRDRLGQARKIADAGDPEHALKLIGSLEDEIAAASEKADQHYIPGLIQADVQDCKNAIGRVGLVERGLAEGKAFAERKRWRAADVKYQQAARALEELQKASFYIWSCLPKDFDPRRKKNEVSGLQLAISGEVANEKEFAYRQLCGPTPVVAYVQGEVVGLKASIQRRAHDPDSIEIVGCTTPVLSTDTCWLFQCSVRGKNALGARVLQTRSYQRSALGFHDETNEADHYGAALEIEGPAPPGEPPVPRAQRGCCAFEPALIADDPNPLGEH